LGEPGADDLKVLPDAAEVGDYVGERLAERRPDGDDGAADARKSGRETLGGRRARGIRALEQAGEVAEDVDDVADRMADGLEALDELAAGAGAVDHADRELVDEAADVLDGGAEDLADALGDVA
jgi:hypothetical protein